MNNEIESELLYYSKKHSKFIPCRCEIKGSFFIQYESQEKHKNKVEIIKNKINLEECIKMSVYCFDSSWEILDSKSNAYRFMSNNKIHNDEWRSIIEKTMGIQKKILEEKNEFGIEVDIDKSSDSLKQVFKADVNYTLVIGEILEIRNSLNKDSVKMDYKAHIRNYGSTKLNQLRMELGSKFQYGEGVLYLSFVDDVVSGIVNKKISDITNLIRKSQSPKLSREEKELVDQQLAKKTLIENSPKTVEAPAKKVSRIHSYDNKNIVIQTPSDLTHQVQLTDSLYEDAGDPEPEIKLNIKPTPSPNLNIRQVENEYKNKIKPPPLPARPNKSIIPQPQSPTITYDTFSNVCAVNDSQYSNAPTTQKPINNKPIYVYKYDKLLNTPQKIWEAKRLLENSIIEQTEHYEKSKNEN